MSPSVLPDALASLWPPEGLGLWAWGLLQARLAPRKGLRAAKRVAGPFLLPHACVSSLGTGHTAGLPLSSGSCSCPWRRGWHCLPVERRQTAGQCPHTCVIALSQKGHTVMSTPEEGGDSLAGNRRSMCLNAVPSTDKAGRECRMGLKGGSGMGRARNAQAGACQRVSGCRQSTSGEQWAWWGSGGGRTGGRDSSREQVLPEPDT